MFRRRRTPELPPAPPTPDLTGVPPRLEGAAVAAYEAGQRWRGVVADMAPGPLAGRLAELGARVDAGVAEVLAAARRVGEVERVVDGLDPAGASAALKAARRRAAAGQEPPELAALEARFASVQRMLNAAADAEARLPVLEARLLAVVAKGAEVALTADDGGVGTLDADLESVVGELGALRQALATLN